MRVGHDIDEFVARVEAELGVPVFREAREHGLVGRGEQGAHAAELRAAIEHAFTFDEWLLAEAMVAGREIEVGILGDDPPVASVPGEVVPAADFYDYADKYEDGKAELRRACAVAGRADRGGPTRSRCSLSKPAGAKRWPGSTSSSATTGCSSSTR